MFKTIKEFINEFTNIPLDIEEILNRVHPLEIQYTERFNKLVICKFYENEYNLETVGYLTVDDGMYNLPFKIEIPFKIYKDDKDKETTSEIIKWFQNN